MTKLSSKKVLQENDNADPSSIKSITLTHRALSDVSCLNEFKNLERLDLSSNSLTSLEGLKACANLKWLSVVQNMLQSLKGIEGLTKLTVLNAGKNKLKSMDEITSIVSLRAVILNDNEISSISKLGDLKELNTLVLSRNPIREIGVSLAKNKLMTKLSLSHCQLEAIGSSLTSCTDLKELRLTHNDIKTLPVELSHNSRLQNLDLGNNSITNWSDIKVLSSLVNLKNLNLHGNPVAELQTSVKKIQKLVPNLQIYNGRPMDKFATKDGDKIGASDKELFDTEAVNKDSMAKKSKKKSRLEQDDNEVPESSEMVKKSNVEKEQKRREKEFWTTQDTGEDNDVIGKSDKKLRTKLKPSEENVFDNGEAADEDTSGKKGKRKSRLEKNEGGNSGNLEIPSANSNIEKKLKKQKKELVNNQDDKELRKSKKSKTLDGSVIDNTEAPFLELFATGSADNDMNSGSKLQPETGPADILVTTPTKTKKNKKQRMPAPNLDISPVAEVGLGGPSSWD